MIFFFFFEILNFLKDLKILINEFFLEILKILNFFKELKVLIDVTSPMPLVPRPFLKISFFFFFFERFRKNYYYYYLKYEDLFIIKKWRRWRWRWSESDEDLFMMILFIYFLFFEKPILWMRITLAGSLCRLLDKSLLNSCKKIISISNGFIHWN